MALTISGSEGPSTVENRLSPFGLHTMEDNMNTQDQRISPEDAAWRGVHEHVGRQVLNTAVNTWNAIKYMAELMAELVADYVKDEDTESFDSDKE